MHLWIEAVPWPAVNGNDDPFANEGVHLTRLNPDLWNTSLRRNEHVCVGLQRQNEKSRCHKQ